MTKTISFPLISSFQNIFVNTKHHLDIQYRVHTYYNLFSLSILPFSKTWPKPTFLFEEKRCGNKLLLPPFAFCGNDLVKRMVTFSKFPSLIRKAQKDLETFSCEPRNGSFDQ